MIYFVIQALAHYLIRLQQSHTGLFLAHKQVLQYFNGDRNILLFILEEEFYALFKTKTWCYDWIILLGGGIEICWL